MTDSCAGRLLVASPALEDPNFARTVVLICAHSDEGAFGLVINRELEDVRVGDVLPAWTEHVSSPPTLFAGGPVERTAAFALARWASPGAAGSIPISGGLALFDLDADPQSLPELPLNLRVYAGYAGWGAGQLDGEISSGAWFVVDLDPVDPFSEAPGGLWRDVLLRQGGRLAMFAHFPKDPAAN